MGCPTNYYKKRTENSTEFGSHHRFEGFYTQSVVIKSSLNLFLSKALFKKTQSFYINQLLYPTLAILPPIVIAFVTNDLTTLVGVTGSYAGAGVQYVVPATLIYYARREAALITSRSSETRNRHRYCGQTTCTIYSKLAKYSVSVCV